MVTEMEDITGVAIPIKETNLNTDQIIPARYLKKPRGDGYHDYLFYDLRFDEKGNEQSDFILNQPKYHNAKILVGGQNFACGSSREGAVYALFDYGIRCVIAQGFSDIFYANCVKNFLLPIVLPEKEVTSIWDYLQASNPPEVSVSLQDCKIVFGKRNISFPINEEIRKKLIAGKDEVDYTLEHISAIERYEELSAQDD